MRMRIVFRDPSGATYELAEPLEIIWSSRVPVEGEIFETDGSNPAMPEQLYYVAQVRWLLYGRGLECVEVHVHPQDRNAWEKT